MLMNSTILNLPPLKSLTITTKNSFLHGSSKSLCLLKKPNSSLSTSQSPPSFLPTIRAMRTLQGRVVCATSDKTVAVEVTRLAPHPKYKRRVRSKKKYQAHDPENQFKVGDVVQLEKCRPISKMKTFLAVAMAKRNVKKKTEQDGEVEGEDGVANELGIALESQQLAA